MDDGTGFFIFLFVSFLLIIAFFTGLSQKRNITDQTWVVESVDKTEDNRVKYQISSNPVLFFVDSVGKHDIGDTLFIKP